MIKKSCIALLVGILLVSACWFFNRGSASKGRGKMAVGVSSSEVKVAGNLEVSSGLLQKDPSNRQPEVSKDDVGSRLGELKSELFISGEDLKSPKLRFRQQDAIRRLGEMRRPEAVAVLMEALLNPQQKFLAKATASDGKIYTSSYELMEVLDGCLEGLPEPKDVIYTDADVPRFEAWWNANKSNLHFKPQRNGKR